MTETTSKNNKRQLYILMGLPLAVVVLATLVFFTGLGVPSGTFNNGVLISPPRQLNDHGIDFQAPDSPFNKPVWTLLQIAPNGCEQDCEEKLMYARQMRTSLGRRTPGLSRMLWLPDTPVKSARLKAEHEDLRFAALPSESQLATLFEGLVMPQQHQFYLIDPRGFLMMYYTSEQDYKEIIHDLKFLLTQSGY